MGPGMTHVYLLMSRPELMMTLAQARKIITDNV